MYTVCQKYTHWKICGISIKNQNLNHRQLHRVLKSWISLIQGKGFHGERRLSDCRGCHAAKLMERSF